MLPGDPKESKSEPKADDAEELAKFGITRVAVDYFHCGPFRYTNLKDAIAQARRQQKPV